jgi:hypothetical protein
MRLGWCRRARGDRGASAVELALVSVVLFPLLFGIVDYGMWFGDSLNTRQGVREAVRRGVVADFAMPDGCAAATDVNRLACIVEHEVGAVAGDAAVEVRAPQGWKKGAPLVVCAAVRVHGVTGLTPLPNDRIVSSMTRMSIEVDDPLPTGVSASAPSESSLFNDPSGDSWAWCA